MVSIQQIVIIILILVFTLFFIRFLAELFSKRKKKFERKKQKPKKRKTDFLSKKIKSKAERKYRKLLVEFKKKNKRKASKNDLFKVVIAASHHTFPVKGRNVKKWTKGTRGHWNRQKVRKYLLEKHKIVENYKMK